MSMTEWVDPQLDLRWQYAAYLALALAALIFVVLLLPSSGADFHRFFGKTNANLVVAVASVVGAAALWFLREGETPEADGILSTIPDLSDCHSQYLCLVLKLHSATRKKDRAVMDSLKDQIARFPVADATLDKALAALDGGDFSLASTYETDALLKLAA